MFRAHNAMSDRRAGKHELIMTVTGGTDGIVERSTGRNQNDHHPSGPLRLIIRRWGKGNSVYMYAWT
jgi:hypothetical protein